MSKPRKIKFKPRFIISAPNQDKHWAITAAGMILAPNAFQYYDHVAEEYNSMETTPGAETNSIPLPDEYAHQTLLRQSLSDEANYVLDLIFNAPMEILQTIRTPVSHNITSTRISAFLRKSVGWSNDRINQTFNEIRRYVANL